LRAGLTPRALSARGARAWLGHERPLAIERQRTLNLGDNEMTLWTRKVALIAALIGSVWLAIASPTLADVKDYEFQLVQTEVKKGEVIVAARLVNKKTRQAVPDAVIFAKRIDMAPDGMATMDSPLEALPSTEPGIYRFKTNLSMAGRWQLSLGARVQGETGTVESKLVLKVLP
jgi:hypothetical protein